MHSSIGREEAGRPSPGRGRAAARSFSHASSKSRQQERQLYDGAERSMFTPPAAGLVEYIRP
eukprot:4354503-Pyramimonas_sp.AAC.1